MLDGISNFERKRVKNLVNCSFHCSSALCRTPTLPGVPAQIVEKNIGRPLQMLQRDVSSTTFVSTVFVARFNFLEKHSVKVSLTGWKTARPRSRAPPECRRAAWRPAPRTARSVASACVLARFPLPRGASRQSPSRRPPRNAHRRLGTRVAPYGRGVLSSGPSPDPC
jgi:hypothetical protein